MPRFIVQALLVALLLIPPASAQAEGSAGDILDKDLELLMQWFPGEYDNQEQVYFNELREIPEEERHERIHHIFYPVDLPAFGEHVLYVQQYLDDKPDEIYRQRIYVFTADYEEMAIRLDILTPKDPGALVDAHLDPSRLEGLTPDDVTPRPGCEVFWRRQANQFHGDMKERACNFVSQRSGKRIFIDDDLVLTASEIWIRDMAEDEDGNYVFGNRAGIHHKNRKARSFSCWVAVERTEGEGWYFEPSATLFDQGGRVTITTDEAEPQSLMLKMRNVVWPFGPNRPSLVLYVHKDDPNRAESYAWTEPTGTRIAINLRWMQASCTLDEDHWTSDLARQQAAY